MFPYGSDCFWNDNVYGPVKANWPQLTFIFTVQSVLTSNYINYYAYFVGYIGKWQTFMKAFEGLISEGAGIISATFKVKMSRSSHSHYLDSVKVMVKVLTSQGLKELRVQLFLRETEGQDSPEVCLGV